MPPPNLLLITTDQQRADSLSCYGSSFTSTPNLDRLAQEGALFERAYCANPVCTPSRATIFGGKYPSRHGAWNVGMNVPDDQVFLSHLLAAAGYRSHYIGKAHFQSFGAPAKVSKESLEDDRLIYPEWNGPYYGFETVELSPGHTNYGIRGHYGAWVQAQVGEQALDSLNRATRLTATSFGGEAYDWDLPVRLHQSTWAADRAVDFLSQRDRKHPFLLAVGFQDPHHPHCLPRDFSLRLDPQAVPLPQAEEGDLEHMPPHYLEARCGLLEKSAIRGKYWVAGQGPGADFRQVSEADARLGRAYYYSMVRSIDQQVGRILDCLKECNLAQNTIVVFTTDHGELLGDHGLWMKGPFHYEPLIRVPLLLRWPEGIPGGQRLSSIASHVDLAPTLLAACGLAIAEDFDGLDALPLLQGKAPAGREAALVEFVDDPGGLRLKTMVTQRWKLTWYARKPYGELLDLDSDPQERTNLWDDPNFAPVKASLLARLLDTTERLERRAERDCYA